MKLLHFKIKTAWYVLLFGASMLPALLMAPWLIDKAQGMLLENSLLKEQMFHQDISVRITLESKRLLAVLENKAEFISEHMAHGEHDFLADMFRSISNREPILNSISLYGKDLKTLTVFKREEHKPPVLNASSPELIIPLQGRSFFSSPVKLNDEHYEFLIAVPIFHKNRVEGVLVTSVNMNDFWASITVETHEHHSMVYLIDNRGSLLTSLSQSRHQQGDLLSHAKIVRTLIADKPWHKIDRYNGFENEQVFGIGSVIDHVDWNIISEIPASKIMAEIHPLLIVLGFIVFFIHAFFGLVGFFLTHRLLKPISLASKVATEVAAGNYNLKMANNSHITEIQQLSSAFNHMVQELDCREKSMQKMQQAMEQAGESIIISDKLGSIEYANSAYYKASGFSAEECLGKSVRFMMRLDLHPKKLFAVIWKQINRGETWSGEVEICKKDGATYPVFMSISPILSAGKITNFLAIQQDISKQLALESQLQQSQKMEAIGVLAGGVAHQFNNLLAGITGNLYLAKRKLQQEQPFEEATTKIETAENLCKQAAEMVSYLLTFSSQATLESNTFCLNQLIMETLALSKIKLLGSIKVNPDITPAPLHIHGDQAQVKLMIINLLKNANDALTQTPQPRLTLSLKRFDAPEAFLQSHTELTTSTFAIITVEDNGSGISKENLAKIYTPFFTTKSMGEGTGLGLAMVYGAIQSLSGLIHVSSRLGKGTTFTIYIPLQDQTIEKDVHQEDANLENYNLEHDIAKPCPLTHQNN